MDNKYLIILLFIFLVFLMGSINSTVTTNYYNNTTESQDHAILSNLSYTTSGHTGFASTVSLGLVQDDIDSINMYNSVQDENIDLKANKSGDIIDYVKINNTNITISTAGTGTGTSLDIAYDNAPPASFAFRAYRSAGLTGTQFYGYAGATNITSNAIHRFAVRLANGNMISPYETVVNQYGQFDFQGYGISGFNTVSARIENVFTQNGSVGRGATLNLYATPDGGSLTKFLSSNGTYVTLSTLSGTGNDYSCLDSTGTFYRDPTGCS